jgi:SAM-dependent methyltransferase
VAGDEPDLRLRDTISVDLPYNDWIAEAYELFMPYDAAYGDDWYFRRAVERAGGTALELGCGTGRLLLRYVAAGLDIEGIDVSADMLTICRRNAKAAGVDPVLHEGSIAPLTLGRRYRLLYCPAGSFMLFYDRAVALDALRSYLGHLEPGGALMISMGVPWNDLDANWEWRVRRTATRPTDDVTVMVHEAVHCDRDAQLQDSLLRYEWWNSTGALVESRVRRHRLRWWYAEELAGTLEDLGYVDVRIDGGGEGFIAVAHAPALAAVG